MQNMFLIKIGRRLLNFLHLQLFISLIALPILLCWGLPISLLSPVGNLIWGPALTLFLFLSSLLFFTELIYIPNGWLAHILDTFTQWWLQLLHIDGHPWLYGFAKPSLFLVIAIPCIALAILHCKKIMQVWQQTVCLLGVLIISCLFIQTLHTKTHSIETLACNHGKLTIIHDAEQLIVIDPGVIGQRISAPSWIEYTCIPHLIKTSGKTTIDHLILLQPGTMLFQAITTLISKIKVKKIYLVYWQGSLTKSEWSSFFGMKRAIEKHNTILERMNYKKIVLPLSAGSLEIVPLKDQITQKEIRYPAIQVHGTLDGTPINLYSYKYKRQAAFFPQQQKNR